MDNSIKEATGEEDEPRRSQRIRNRVRSLDDDDKHGQGPKGRKEQSVRWSKGDSIITGSSGSDEDDDFAMGIGKFDDDYGTDYDPQSPSAAFPPTYLVLRLAPNIQPAAVSWLVRKITGKKGDGGAELLLRCEPYEGRKKENLVLHISASKLKFLEIAEYLELKKVDCNGELREFTVADLDNFLYNDVTLDSLLTPAERQMIVVNELENIRAVPGEETVPGYPLLSVFKGQSIFNLFLAEKLITSFYPLHDDLEVSALGERWYWTFLDSQPFEEIRKYFGDSISLYFSFLGFYTTSLCAPALLGILHRLFPESASNYSLIFFSVFNVIWVTVTLEVWKRKCNKLAYSWGTLRMTKWEEPRSNYRGKMIIDPVSGRYQPKYPWWKTALKAYGVSFPIVLVCLFGAFYIMLYSFWIEDALVHWQQENPTPIGAFLVYVPSVVYTILVYIMNMYYRELATHLTEWENHRTASQFDRHRVTKLVLFEFVNNFMSLFYIAFYLQDFEMLKYQVFVMLIILQAINHFQEALLPLVLRKASSCVACFTNTHSKLKDEDVGRRDSIFSSDSDEEPALNPANLGLHVLDHSDPRIEKSKLEGEMDPYEGTFDDYLELFIQFGYVFLFSSVYPLAAVWAIINNVLEIRTDAFKLCKVFQRPIGRRTKDIGAWQIAFEVMGGIAVMTNCGLLYLSEELRAIVPHLTPVEWLLLFVTIEHCLLGLTIALQRLIPDVPYKIKMAMARLEYQSRQALKNEQTFKSRRQLTRRFKTIHGPRSRGSVSLEAPNAASRSPSPSPMTRRRVIPTGKYVVST